MVEWIHRTHFRRHKMADYAHEAWSGWMRYLFSNCEEVGDGGLTIPPSLVARWTRQMSTPYIALPEHEQVSDLAEADKILSIVTAKNALPNGPTIVCLCGSTRFMEAFQAANLSETLAGRIVLTVGCDTKSDAMLGIGDDVKARLDELHKRKIDLADEILVLNVGGYVGSSTRSEIDYAVAHGKRVRWLEEPGRPASGGDA